MQIFGVRGIGLNALKKGLAQRYPLHPAFLDFLLDILENMLIKMHQK